MRKVEKSGGAGWNWAIVLIAAVAAVGLLHVPQGCAPEETSKNETSKEEVAARLRRAREAGGGDAAPAMDPADPADPAVAAAPGLEKDEPVGAPAPPAAVAEEPAKPVAAPPRPVAARPRPPVREPLAKLDFDAGMTPLSVSAKGKVGGELPEGWQDDSAWADLDVHYSRVEDTLGGDTYLAMEVSRIGGGVANLRRVLDSAPEPGNYTIRLSARSPGRNAVSVGIRRIGRPFNYFWQREVHLEAGRKDFEFEFSLPAIDDRVGLFLLSRAPGLVEISRFELAPSVPLGEDGDSPALNPANIAAVSRFPGGILPIGWGLPLDAEFAPAAESIGDESTPSGFRALRVSAPKEATLYSHTYAVDRTGPVFAAIQARGEGNVMLRLRDGTNVIGNSGRQFCGGSWSRTIARAELPGGTRNLNIQVTISGEVEIDALQIGFGDPGEGYQPSASAEIVLAAGEGEAALARVFFEDETPNFRYIATGDVQPGAFARVRVSDVFGGEYPDMALPLDFAGRVAEGGFQLDPPGAPRYAAFRIEARVESADGDPLSHWSEIVFHRQRRPRHWGTMAPEDSPFGFHVRARDPELTMAKASGVAWARLHATGSVAMNWYSLEPARGQWRWRDDVVELYHERGFRILGVLVTAPKWASHFNQGNHGYYDMFYAPKDLKAWENYVKTIASRYQDKIQHWNVWNEPWGLFWHVDRDASKSGLDAYIQEPQEERAKNYSRITEIARRALRSVSPRMKAVGLETSPNPKAVGWTEDVIKGGGIKASDIVCFHQYNSAPIGFPGDPLEEAFDRIIGPIKRGGKLPIPVWQTEGQPNLNMHQYGLYHHTVGARAQDNNVVMAERLAAFHATYLAIGVEKIFVYSMGAAGTLGLQMFWPSMILGDNSLHPSAGGYSAMTWMLEGTKFVRRFQNRHGNTVHLFEGGGRSVALIIAQPGQQRQAVPATDGISGYEVFGNPLQPGAGSPNNVLYLTLDGPARRLAAAIETGKR